MNMIVDQRRGVVTVSSQTGLMIIVETGEGDWQERGLCAQTDPEAFFPEKGGSTRAAKRICSGCDVRTECLEYALRTDQRFGIFGGMTVGERRRESLARNARAIARLINEMGAA